MQCPYLSSFDVLQQLVELRRPTGNDGWVWDKRRLRYVR